MFIRNMNNREKSSYPVEPFCTLCIREADLKKDNDKINILYKYTAFEWHKMKFFLLSLNSSVPWFGKLP